MSATSLFAARMRLQARLRARLEQSGYHEVATFALQPAPGMDPQLEPISAIYRPLMDRRLAERMLYLHTSPEFAMKRLLCRDMKKIYQLGPAFRQGELGPLHTPEFTIAEWYQAGWTWSELMQETEKIVCDLLEGTAIVRAKKINLSPPLPRIAVDEAFRQVGVDLSRWDRLDHQQYRENFERAYLDKLEPWLEKQGALFLTRFPEPLALLAKLEPGPEPTAERFELIVGGIELANGCSELTDPDENLDRINRDLEARRRLGKAAPPPPRAFINDLKSPGLPECAGAALGVERLAMIALGADTIEQVQALPFGA